MERIVSELHSIGIISGLSLSVTELYLSSINRLVNAHYGDYNYPNLVYSQANFAEYSQWVAQRQWETLSDDLVIRATELSNQGAEAIVILSSALHRAAPQITAAGIPLLHVGDAIKVTVQRTRAEIQKGFSKPYHQRLGLVCTSATRDSGVFDDYLQDSGAELYYLDEHQQRNIDQLVTKQLRYGKPRKTFERVIYDAITALHIDHLINGVILGDMELNLGFGESLQAEFLHKALDPKAASDFKIYDAAQLHLQMIADFYC